MIMQILIYRHMNVFQLLHSDLMPTNKNKIRLGVAAVISVLIVIFGVVLPLADFYGPLLSPQPSITVLNGYANATYSGDFKNNSSANDYFFPNDIATANVSGTSGPNSTLTLGIGGGRIYYESGIDVLHIEYFLSVSGHFTSNLHPKSLTLLYNSSGPKNQTGVSLDTFAPPFASWGPNASHKPVSNNLSYDKLGYLSHSGFGSVSVTTDLLNESSSLKDYNFSVSAHMEITLNLYPNSTHAFLLEAQVNGLQKLVDSCVEFSVNEVNI